MNWYLEALKKYAVFSGRARRKEFWYFYLFSIILFIPIYVIGYVIGIIFSNAEIGALFLVFLYGLAMWMPHIAVSARRLHDTGRKDWWLLLLLVPLIGQIVLLVFMVQDSHPGANQYGPNPKDGKKPEKDAQPVEKNRSGISKVVILMLAIGPIIFGIVAAIVIPFFIKKKIPELMPFGWLFVIVIVGLIIWILYNSEGDHAGDSTFPAQQPPEKTPPVKEAPEESPSPKARISQQDEKFIATLKSDVNKNRLDDYSEEGLLRTCERARSIDASSNNLDVELSKAINALLEEIKKRGLPQDVSYTGSLPKAEVKAVEKSSTSDEEFFAEALKEFESADRQVGVWAKSFAEAQGNESIAKANYLQVRAKQIARVYVQERDLKIKLMLQEEALALEKRKIERQRQEVEQHIAILKSTVTENWLNEAPGDKVIQIYKEAQLIDARINNQETELKNIINALSAEIKKRGLSPEDKTHEIPNHEHTSVIKNLNRGFTWAHAVVGIIIVLVLVIVFSEIKSQTDRQPQNKTVVAEPTSSSKEAQGMDERWKESVRVFYAENPDYANDRAKNLVFIEVVNRLITTEASKKMTDKEVLEAAKKECDATLLQHRQ